MLMIIDYGIGNLGSIKNMIQHVGADAYITNEPSQLKNATGIILPGVGSFGRGMDLLHKGNWIDALNSRTLQGGVPTLGICLGMQLMARQSEESTGIEGLGWLEADVVRFQCGKEDRLRVPHMGWNTVKPRPHSALIENDGVEKRFYFVHSYHVICDYETDIAGTTSYGQTFVSSVQHGNIFGIQPHPEKSHRFGMNVFKKFLGMTAKSC